MEANRQIVSGVIEMKLALLVAEYASHLDIGRAALSTGMSKDTALALIQSERGVEMFQKELSSRMERLKVSGDRIVMELMAVAEEARGRGKHREAIEAYKAIGELLGLTGKGNVSINPNGNTQIVFGGGRPS